MLQPWEQFVEVAGYSWLQPGAIIPEHTDDRDEMAWTVVVHTGLTMNQGDSCYLDTAQTGSVERMFESTGKTICFDDKFPHSARNGTDADRVILYLKCRVLPPKDERWTEGLKEGSDEEQLQTARDARNGTQSTPNALIQSDLQWTLEALPAEEVSADSKGAATADANNLPMATKGAQSLWDKVYEPEEALPEIVDLIEQQVRRGVQWDDLGPLKGAVRKKYNRSSYNRALLANGYNLV